ncbi:CDP-glycerol glycerophosphotransferase family protein [Arthrobacter sp. 3Tela_A]|uniref:CDP-glycerol glycerophosphotransferase family protein n=1 Tax=Arthrobacter sp. 3Tela_A TaxID=3093743 RepID=UPI003BB80D03
MIGWQALYALARNLEKKEDWKGAASQYERILRRGSAEPKVYFRLGHAYFRMNSLAEALQYLRQAVDMDPSNADWQYRLGFVLERTKAYQEALSHYRTALELVPQRTEWHRRIDTCNREITRLEIAKLRETKAPSWRQAEALQEAAELHADDGAWMERTGDAQFKMGQYQAAAESYVKGTKSRKQDATLHFKAGWAALLASDEELSEQYFAEAIRLDKKLGSKRLGIGAFFQHRGRWQLAADFYERTLRSGTESPELYFRLGVAKQKSYDWSSSADVFREAIALWPTTGKFHWRLGLSYERMGELKCAAEAYANALVYTDGDSSYWKYRLGYVLQRLGRFSDANVAYFLSRENSAPPSPDSQRKVGILDSALTAELRQRVQGHDPTALGALAQRAESVGCWAVAVEAYREIAARQASFDAGVYHLLGRALMAIGNDREAADAFAETRRFKRPHGVDVSLYSKNANQLRSMYYLEHVETLPLAEDTILYESGHGASMSGNPLQICRQLVEDDRFTGYKHIWVLNPGNNPQEEFSGNEDFIFVPRDSDLYLRYLATAKYLINDNTFPPYFARREGQRYLNTWHGTPIKTLGRDIKGGNMDHKNAARNFLHATHMIAPNKFTADCLLEKYDVAGIFDGRIAITGYPRVDASLSASAAKRAELKRKLGVPEGKQVVLYAPTWRGSLAERSLDTNRLAADLKHLSSGDWHFLYRGHSMTSNQEDASLIAAHGVPATVDTNDLLSITDVLITDYSSVFFDFIPLQRPIIYYAYDLELYTEDRGLYFDLESMPGVVCGQIEEVVQEVTAAVKGNFRIDETVYAEATERFCSLEDGGATKRAVQFFFFEDSSFEMPNKQDDKTNVLMFQGSFMPNGITSSYLNLVAHIDPESTNLYTVLDPVALASEPSRIEKFAERPDHVRVLARVGAHLVTPEERWVIDKLNHQHSLATEEMWDIVRRAFAREFARVFGTASFNTIICFEGYARFWVSLFASAPEAVAAKKVIYLHNDMHREWQERFEYLESNFRMYRHFDALISVTKSVRDENRANLGTKFGVESNRFTYANNLVNPVHTLEMATQPLDEDIADWVGDCDALFVTMGRLSPEKGHKKLVQAFEQVLEDRPHAKLLILGHGPLHDPLQDLIAELGLEDSVLLAGRRVNPFPALKRADCFVFSSEYEGQGLAVLEALILAKPVISTDVVGPRSVLEEGHGLLVENSIEGLVSGFKMFFCGGIPKRRFEVDVYQKEAMEKFLTIAL